MLSKCTIFSWACIITGLIIIGTEHHKAFIALGVIVGLALVFVVLRVRKRAPSLGPPPLPQNQLQVNSMSMQGSSVLPLSPPPSVYIQQPRLQRPDLEEDWHTAHTGTTPPPSSSSSPTSPQFDLNTSLVPVPSTLSVPQPTAARPGSRELRRLDSHNPSTSTSTQSDGRNERDPPPYLLDGRDGS